MLAPVTAGCVGDDESAAMVDTNGLSGTVDDVRAQLSRMVDAEGTHLVLNPVDEHLVQLERLVEVLGLVS